MLNARGNWRVAGFLWLTVWQLCCGSEQGVRPGPADSGPPIRSDAADAGERDDAGEPDDAGKRDGDRESDAQEEDDGEETLVVATFGTATRRSSHRCRDALPLLIRKLQDELACPARA
jgi:hypothetical protein